jgi:hypothetical protein
MGSYLFYVHLSMINADWNRVLNRSNKSKIKQPKTRLHSALKRINVHKINKNPLESVGRMRVRTLGKKRIKSNEDIDGNNMFDISSNNISSNFVKKEIDDSSSSSIMEYKYYGEDKNIYQPRPTSSTSSDADFNYLAGCGLPTDIFEPSNV